MIYKVKSGTKLGVKLVINALISTAPISRIYRE